MKHLPIFATALLGALASCASNTNATAHWKEHSIAPRVTRAFLSYDGEDDGRYIDFQWQKKQAINMTVRRHLFNHNPENPFQASDDSVYAPRPTHSLVPRPWNYIHLEGMAMGAIAYAAGGMFIPVPVDSVIATLSDEGGEDEFMEGVGEFVRPLGVVTASFLHDAVGLPRRTESEVRSDD
ncbi:MAG: hypothetical protein ACKVWV_15445 [Planctomycetota bacterium]